MSDAMRKAGAEFQRAPSVESFFKFLAVASEVAQSEPGSDMLYLESERNAAQAGVDILTAEVEWLRKKPGPERVLRELREALGPDVAPNVREFCERFIASMEALPWVTR